MKPQYKPIQLRARRDRTVGARVRSTEYAAFEEIARRRGISQGTLCALLVRTEIARHAAPSFVPDTAAEAEPEERLIYA